TLRYWLKDTDLTRLRAKHPWLAAGSVVAQQQVLRDFRRSKARRFKSARRDLPSLSYTKRGFSIQTGRLHRFIGSWLGNGRTLRGSGLGESWPRSTRLR